MLEDNETAFSRACSDPFGPLDDSLELRINGDIKIELMQRARKMGFPTYSEYVRNMIILDLKGEAHVLSVMTKRILGDRTPVVHLSDKTA